MIWNVKRLRNECMSPNAIFFLHVVVSAKRAIVAKLHAPFDKALKSADETQARFLFKMTVYMCLLVCLVLPATRAQKTPAKVTSRGGKLSTAGSKYLQCDFPVGQGVTKPTSVHYNRTTFVCVGCNSHRTLVRLELLRISGRKSFCDSSSNVCNGLLCGGANSTCVLAHQLQDKDPNCRGARISASKPFPMNQHERPAAAGQIPLIIGFTVGGILLAIVVAGIFLGRNQRADPDTSEVMTTPMSLSNSEWMSNGGGSAVARQLVVENMRVQEASTEDVSNIIGYDVCENGYPPDAKTTELLLRIATEDSSSVGQNSYYGCEESNTYSLPRRFSAAGSYRSEDVIMLDDGYVAGGNFIGSADPEVRQLFEPKSDSHQQTENDIQFMPDSSTHGETIDQDDLFWGKSSVPGSMAHESITLSLTHQSNFGGIEYIIEDQDLVAFDEPSPMSRPWKDPVGTPGGGEERSTRIHLQYRDKDSDFEETESVRSHPDSAVKSDKSDVFSDTQSTAGDNVGDMKTRSALQVESPCSESGIEVSCNSKDSCEIRVVSIKTSNSSENMEISCHTRSWNENCKGNKTSIGVESSRRDTSNANRFFGHDNRSRSCTWKSPAAPTHSSSRKFSAPIHCPSSAPARSRQQEANLTHVFVDVHRSMLSSDEDLLAMQPTERRAPRKASSFSSSEGGSLSDLAVTSTLPISENAPFSTSSMRRSCDIPSNRLANERRNKSAYLSRARGRERTPEWARRTVRFSSSGSGEYAIPFGSLVP